jgi:elongation factor P--(R)-beta-lysine ligase
VNAPPWKPTASLEMLKLRAKSLAQIRDFFAERRVLEVETPALSTAGISDPALEQMLVHTAENRACYLQTSPELPMKRLLAAGSGDIYQICHVYRDSELGRWHEPEFTLLEWYRLGWDEDRLMLEVESLLETLLRPSRRLEPTVQLSYEDAFLEFLSVSPTAGEDQLRAALAAKDIDVPTELGKESLLDLALSLAVLPRLNPNAATFIFDYPANQASLAKLKLKATPVAARFELFLGGIELANGFAELTDADEQQRRFELDLRQRRQAGRHEPPMDDDFLEALRHGLPSCAGVAIGLDRLLAVMSDADRVADTMAFPQAPSAI